MRHRSFIAIAGLVSVVVACLASCAGVGCEGGRRASTASLALPPLDAVEAASYPGLHNVVAYAPNLFEGSVPEGDAGFATLASMGVRTIISVDGASPDVAAAQAHGIRYIHLPIGYNGMDRARTLEIAKAVHESEADGPVYMHCHHGKHRSAGALGAAAVTLGYLSPEEATARMRVSGTAANYVGLFQCVAVATPASSAELASVPSDFPAVCATTGLVTTMVEVDEVFDHLKLVEAAGWTAPTDHPDLVPLAEAARLADLFRTLRDDERVKRKPAEFSERLLAASRHVESLEAGLADSGVSSSARSNLFKPLAASCKECHAKYRD